MTNLTELIIKAVKWLTEDEDDDKDFHIDAVIYCLIMDDNRIVPEKNTTSTVYTEEEKKRLVTIEEIEKVLSDNYKKLSPLEARRLGQLPGGRYSI